MTSVKVPLPLLWYSVQLAVGGDEEVGKAVVVVVGDGAAHAERVPPATPAFSVTSVKVPSRLFLYSAFFSGVFG